ncbi:hypothetical protein BDY19DRAFT_891510 [Irpex rosettiformis]|uniref:Uncharacterized protein n=1 Tax=Irpex rosettiformis TaxID=378272 RepID=A0ACB8U1U2_9APHY|nr:hypothetical protein BDY19DRAFT_891510 [Irpex rosettiformis]
MLRTAFQTTRRTSRQLSNVAARPLRDAHPLRRLSSLSPRNPPFPPHSRITSQIGQSLRISRGCSSQPPASFADPDRPELYYHLFHPPSSVSDSTPVFALSFLSVAPRTANSSTILGWLPALEGGEAGLNDFRENPKFLDVLHEAVQSGLRDGVDDIQINGAIQTQQGWMHIHDDRNIPALGRIGDPDDIIASVRVEEGKILAETYQPMPSYRLCTADGVIKLTEGLFERLKQVLEERERAT